MSTLIIASDIADTRLTQGNVTKQTMQDIATRLTDQVVEGEANPLQAYEEIIMLETILEMAKERIKDLAIGEAAKYTKGETLPSITGATITQKAGRRQYDFSNCETIKLMEQKIKWFKECAKKGEPTSDGEILPKPIETFTKDIISIEFK